MSNVDKIQGPNKRYIALGPGTKDNIFIVYDQIRKFRLPKEYNTFELANHAAKIKNANLMIREKRHLS